MSEIRDIQEVRSQGEAVGDEALGFSELFGVLVARKWIVVVSRSS